MSVTKTKQPRKSLRYCSSVSCRLHLAHVCAKLAISDDLTGMKYDMLGCRHLAARMFRYKGLVLIVFALCALSFYFGRFMHDYASDSGWSGLKAEKSLGDRSALPVRPVDKRRNPPQLREQILSRGRPRPLTSRPAAGHFVSGIQVLLIFFSVNLY